MRLHLHKYSVVQHAHILTIAHPHMLAALSCIDEGLDEEESAEHKAEIIFFFLSFLSFLLVLIIFLREHIVCEEKRVTVHGCV